MPKLAYISAGSNTTVKSGPGSIYNVVYGGANGATVFLADSISIGASPNYPSMASATSSNLVVYGPIPATPGYFQAPGSFQIGLTVAATSNCSLSVSYD